MKFNLNSLKKVTNNFFRSFFQKFDLLGSLSLLMIAVFSNSKIREDIQSVYRVNNMDYSIVWRTSHWLTFKSRIGGMYSMLK